MGLLLAGCHGGEKPKQEEPAVNLAALRARRDSIRRAAEEQDSIIHAKWTACSDSVVTALGKTAAGRRKLKQKLPAGALRPEVIAGCGQPPAAAAAQAGTPAAPSDTAHPAPAADTGHKLTPAQQRVARADSIRRARETARQDSLRSAGEVARQDSVAKAKMDSVRGDSVKLAQETEVLRETFTYGGGPRDPFYSLISGEKVGPELADLLLVGVYLDLRRSSNSLAVLRDKTTQKRYKLRVGDKVGRLKVAQIRQRDVVFTVEDIGFERQETLSLPKRQTEESP
jgi:hypothetical protein